MSALTDFLHSIVEKLPFHSETLVNDAHDLVNTVEEDLKNMVETAITEVKSDVAALKSQVSTMATQAGVITASQVTSERQGAVQPTLVDSETKTGQ